MPSDTLSRLTAALADRYRIEREIGAGGMATVYLAEDVRHRRKVAVKVLRPEIAATLGSDRFFREIEVAAQLQHPHILPLLDSGEADGFYYYVMPFVPGESLRERLAKTGELPIQDAVRILSEVVDALAAAHAMGVVHRDVKPDNVMLSGRHALVTDFGVAKAVSEATGRNKLTTAGVALGTPAYMAPEQAAADPHLDHRVDIYAVGAMGYELLSGRPPFTGMTPQEILAAHVTQAPEPIEVRRQAVPPALSSVLMKCLAKRPADRWQTAEELLVQLEPLGTPSGGMTPTQTRPVPVTHETARAAPRSRMLVVAGVVAALLVLALAFVSRRGTHTTVTLRDRVQLTTTGQVSFPAISSDGKQLAYVVAHCDSTCSYAIELKDVGGSTTRRILDGATAMYSLQWSPDRRNLLFAGTIDRRYGMYVVSALGGTARLITGPGYLAFWSGGDSLIVSPGLSADSGYWVGFAGLDGTIHDSIRVAIPGKGLFVMGQPAGTQWIIAALWTGSVAELLTLDRRGRIVSRVALPAGLDMTRVSADAAWARLISSEATATEVVVRVPFAARSGHLSERWDTVYSGQATAFDVTADGGALVVDEGSETYSGWAVELKDALRGVFPENRRLLQSTAPIGLRISPDGNRVLVRRSGVQASGGDQLSVAPFGGGAETPIRTSGPLVGYGWVDSVTAQLGERTTAGIQLSLADVRSGARRAPLIVPDSSLGDFESLGGDSWSWFPSDGRTIKIQRQGQSTPRTYQLPAWYLVGISLRRSPRADKVAVLGWNAATFDSIGLDVFSPADGKFIPWAVWFSEGGRADWLSDGSVGVALNQTQRITTFYRVSDPGRVERVGSVPRQVQSGGTFSADFKRVSVVTVERHGDAWMSTVVRP